MTDAGAITILIVDDHPVVRAGLRLLLSRARERFTIVGEASSGAEAVALARRLLPDVVLMDYAMPGLDGAQATRELRRQVPSSRVVLLVTFETEAEIARGLAAGAAGVVAKDVAPSDLVGLVRRAAR